MLGKSRIGLSFVIPSVRTIPDLRIHAPITMTQMRFGVAEERKEILTHAVWMPTRGLPLRSGERAVATHQHVLAASEYRPVLK